MMLTTENDLKAQGGLPLLVVYRDPHDFPRQFVVRRHWTLPGKTLVEEKPLFVHGSSAAVFEYRRLHHADKVVVPREAADHPTIIETWL